VEDQRLSGTRSAAEDIAAVIAEVSQILRGHGESAAAERLETIAGSVAMSGDPTASPLPDLPPSLSPEKLAAAKGAFLGFPPQYRDELVAEFTAGCRESIDECEAEMLALESGQGDAIDAAFRAVHTLKGNAAGVGSYELTRVCHVAEEVLSRVRAGSAQFTGRVADLLLSGIDLFKSLTQAVSAELREEPTDLPADRADAFVEALRLVALNRYVPEEVWVLATGRQARNRSGGADTPASEEGGESTVRLPVGRLDRLVTDIGELVIAYSMLAGSEVAQLPAARTQLRQLDRIVRGLQDLTMSLRTEPLRRTFQRLARAVRDVASRRGLVIDFQTFGDDVEMDRGLVTELVGPLLHMVRNAADHGIEDPELRSLADKPESGSIIVQAETAGGEVHITVIDDGRGLDSDHILAKAVEKGLADPDRQYSRNEILDLLFVPGFSTKDEVTDVSGRGVGLDVVRQNVTDMGGSIEVDSEPGMGSMFLLRLPLTLAITDGMIVRVGEQRFVLPTGSLRQTFRPEAGSISVTPDGVELCSHRGRLLPILRLHRVFGIEGAATCPEDALLAITEMGSAIMAVMVDEVLGRGQIVTKALGDAMPRVPAVSGATVLSDGAVGLIVDLRELLTLAAEEMKV